MNIYGVNYNLIIKTKFFKLIIKTLQWNVINGPALRPKIRPILGSMTSNKTGTILNSSVYSARRRMERSAMF